MSRNIPSVLAESLLTSALVTVLMNLNYCLESLPTSASAMGSLSSLPLQDFQCGSTIEDLMMQKINSVVNISLRELPVVGG